jgi:hypothetical protein
MHHGLALQIDEGRLARRVHDLQDERASLSSSQMKVVVVFARKRPRGNFQPINLAGQARRFRFRYRMSNPRSEQHALKFICNGAKASTAPENMAVGI